MTISGTAASANFRPQEQKPTDEQLSEPAARPNRLARESSPYLLLHAHNPVDWFPWGPAAFEKAREENKPIFLSVGYSSCYWCHVMERLVFSNPRIAAYMNQHFVNIKVDREERPDVDDIYMTSLIVYQQAAGIGGGGGWPMSLFLTPEGNPIAGATYLPPEDIDGRTGFLTAASQVHQLWSSNPDRLRGSADMIATEVRRLSGPQIITDSVEPEAVLVSSAIEEIKQHYDREYGGVDFKPSRPDGPRFPNVPRLQLLLAAHDAEPNSELLKIVLHSPRSMAHGGIPDHLPGGFHRYSTDRKWHVPHSQKMLYDQAQLLQIYTQAAVISNDPLFADVAGEIADFVKRELTLPRGGFCSALDAETNTIEGEYYVWTPDQIEQCLGDSDAQVFMTVYGMKNPNPFEHGYVLHLPQSVSEAADLLQLNESSLRSQLSNSRTKLLHVRSQRQRPLLDDKVLTEWNAMMIQSLAMSGQLPGRESDIVAAEQAASFILANLRQQDGTLHRSWRNGKSVYGAYLDDYAFLAAALIQLHQATDDPTWLNAAIQITDKQIELFYDNALKTFFYTSHNHEKLIARTSSAYDSTFPSGNSVTIRNLQHLQQTDSGRDVEASQNYSDIAKDTLTRLCPTLKQSPAACAGVAISLLKWLEGQSAPLSQLQSQSSPDGSAHSVASTNRMHRSYGNQLTSLRSQKQEGIDATKSQPDQSKSESGDNTLSAVFKPVFPEPTGASPFAKDENQNRPVQAKIYPMFDKLERGGKCPIAVQLTVDKQWHINANPSKPDFLVPTTLKINSKQKVKMTRVKYPEHELMAVPGEAEPYHVYGNTVTVYALLEIDATETAEAGELEIRIDFQACNKDTCMPPDKILLKGKLPLANPGDPIKQINEDKFPKPKKPSEEKQ